MNIYGGGKSVYASNRVWRGSSPLINKFIGVDGNAHADVRDKNFSFALLFLAA